MVIAKIRKFGIVPFAIYCITALFAYRVFAYETGFCATTLSFNSLEDIERRTVERMLPFIVIHKRKGETVRRPFSSYDEFKRLNPGCCKFSPGGGDSDPFRPNLFDYAAGWTHTFVFGASSFRLKTGEIKKHDYGRVVVPGYHTEFGANTFKIDNCGRYQYKYWAWY